MTCAWEDFWRRADRPELVARGKRQEARGKRQEARTGAWHEGRTLSNTLPNIAGCFGKPLGTPRDTFAPPLA